MIKSVWQRTRDLNVICMVGAIVACSMAQTPIAPPTASDANSGVQRETTLRPLHNFGRGKDGYDPQASLLYYNHRFYGTTEYGGTGGNGTVFEIRKIRSIGLEHILYSFGKLPDGAAPVSSLVELNGKLYGTTKSGGQYQMGTVFRITITGKEEIIYSFRSGTDGANPVAKLTAFKGVLYGTTLNGGTYGEGTVFSLTQDRHWHETVLHSFGSGNDGAYPEGGLIAIKNKFYGTTSGGGGPSGNSYGTVFRVSLNGSEDVVFAFSCLNGAAPAATLIHVNGTFYGTTARGGTACPSAGNGTVFALSSGNDEHVVHDFNGGTTDGSDPVAGLIAWGGKLYGTTTVGGSYAGGTVFSVTPPGDEKVLHAFGNGTDGNRPAGGVIHIGKAYYGTTAGGGRYGGGIVYELF
jgi:uncharacterized repeat protein (TIGR03803 family)